MKQIIAFLLLVLSLLGSWPSFAAEDIEQHAQKLDKLLIAPCCWTATLDEHFSEVSVEMKGQIRQMLSEGKSDDEILAFFESKYGERIRSEPTTSGFNRLAWIFPVLILSVGLGVLLTVLRKKTKKNDDTRVTEIVPILTDGKTASTTPPTSADDEKYRKMIDDELYRS